MSVRRERKYALTRYIKGGYSLNEAKRKSIVVSATATNEYMNTRDRTDLLSLEGGLYKLLVTREAAKDIMKARFAPRTGTARREENIASLMTAFQLKPPLDYSREQAIEGKGKRAKPRIGSSKKIPIGKTDVIGAQRVLRDIRELFRNLQKLQKSGRESFKGEATKVANSVRLMVKNSS